MTLDATLRRLVEKTTPSDNVKNRVASRLQAKIQPSRVLDAVNSVQPSAEFTESVHRRILGRVSLLPSALLPKAARRLDLAAGRRVLLRERILQTLKPVHVPLVHGSIKWAAAFAIVLLAVRSLPLVMLAPITRADLGVQLIASGDVQLLIGGVWTKVPSSQTLRGAVLIKTTDSQATIVMNDDGVFRLGPNTTVRLHDVSDRPHSLAISPTLTLIRGQMWALGLLPPGAQPLTVETTQGILAVSAGSISVQNDGATVVAAAFDRGATFRRDDRGAEVAFVAGERVVARPDVPIMARKFPPAISTAPWVGVNLDQDAVHRAHLTALQEDYRARAAWPLPTSILYPAKRLAEEVDVLFTLGNEARAEKRLAHADSRLNEALTLLKEGNEVAAALPLTEYTQTLIALASDNDDNIVKSLISKQVEEATSSLAVVAPDDQLPAVRQAVLDITAAMPDANLESKDIQGYVLVDRLAALNRSLMLSKNLTGALAAYRDIQPYLKDLLSAEDGTHPLLQKEAKSLLASTSTLFGDIRGIAGVPDVKVIQTEIAQYVPAPTVEDFISDNELNAKAREIYEHVIVNLSLRHSRDRQLEIELEGLWNNPNRGTILRRLLGLLPPRSHWAMRVQEEIHQLGGAVEPL